LQQLLLLLLLRRWWWWCWSSSSSHPRCVLLRTHTIYIYYRLHIHIIMYGF
jgi:hypothetical protein